MLQDDAVIAGDSAIVTNEVTLFLMATVLIIYYKQISEGYEDQRRYQIMQQVGMSRREVGASIRGPWRSLPLCMRWYTV